MAETTNDLTFRVAQGRTDILAANVVLQALAFQECVDYGRKAGAARQNLATSYATLLADLDALDAVADAARELLRIGAGSPWLVAERNALHSAIAALDAARSRGAESKGDE